MSGSSGVGRPRPLPWPRCGVCCAVLEIFMRVYCPPKRAVKPKRASECSSGRLEDIGAVPGALAVTPLAS